MPAMTKIIKKTLRGISKAHKDYKRWTGGDWLWDAPEYMITTYIAKEIASDSPYYVTLEQNAGESTEAGGGVGKGKVPEPARRKLERGRFDIVVWDSDTPVVIIEVKNKVNGFGRIRDDFNNICTVLRSENYHQYGLIAYCIEWTKSKSKSAEQRVLSRVESIKRAADARIKKKGGLELRQHLSHPKPKVVGDSAWTGVVLQISRSNQ